MTTPLEFMKRELEKLDSSIYSEVVKQAALKIAEKFDDEGHSGFSINFFYNAMRRYMSKAHVLRASKPLSWEDANIELQPTFGAGELEETALEDHLTRVRVFDELQIEKPEEVDQVFEVLKLYTTMDSIRPIDLKDESLFESNSFNDNRHHRDNSRFVLYPDGGLKYIDFAIYSPDGGKVWFTGSGSQGVITPDHPQPIRSIYVLRVGDDNTELLPLKRTCRPDALVRNPHGDVFKIEGYASHPDTTQPYFKLVPQNTLTLCGSEPIIVSSDTLMNLEIEYPEVGIKLPAYGIWPADLENTDGE